MSTVANTPNESVSQAVSAPSMLGSHPLYELSLLRLREIVRTPEALFWTFVFPILMACALGIAFRNTAPTKMRVAVENNSPNAASLATTIPRSAEL